MSRRPRLCPALVLCALRALSSDGAHAATLTRGPYLQLGTDEGVTLRWRTDVATDSRVQYGAAPESLSESVLDPALTTEHAVEIVQLAPGTRYYYSVGSSSEVLAGEDDEHFFETSPVAGSAADTRIWVLGDAGTGSSQAAAVRDAFLELAPDRPADLVLMLGDNAYQSGTDGEFQAGLFDMYPTLLRERVFWPAFGNHDGQSADSDTESGPYYDIFSLPRAAEAGGLASGTEAYYSFDYANVHFVALDSYDSDRATDGDMLEWLAQDLAATDQDWIVAFWHHPPYSKGSHDSDTEGILVEMRENAVPLLESLGVDLVLAGHSHGYERSFLIDGHYGETATFVEGMKVDGGDGREEGDGAYGKSAGSHQGAVYVVAGAAGQVDGGSLDHPAMFLSFGELGSLVIDIYGNRLEAFYLRDNGTTPDRFTLLKGSDLYAPLVLGASATSATTVEVRLNEPLAESAAEIVGSYDILSGPVVFAAALLGDGRTVELTTSTLARGVPYTLAVAGVEDLAANAIDPPQHASFQWDAPIAAAFQQGALPDASYAGTEDTTLEQALAGTNHGSSGTLSVDGDDGGGNDLTALVRWDLSAIPSAAVVDHVGIEIDVLNASSDGYELYALLAPWVEGEATWASAANGAPWGAAGANGSADRDPTVLGTLHAGLAGGYQTTLNAAGRAAVQSWIADPPSNHGLAIADTSENDGLDFSSSEAPTQSDRPRLTLVYHLPAACAAPHGDTLVLASDTVAGEEVFEVCTAITVLDDYLVATTGHLTLRSPGQVVFGNGFSVAVGGRLTVEG